MMSKKTFTFSTTLYKRNIHRRGNNFKEITQGWCQRSAEKRRLFSRVVLRKRL